MDRDRFHGIWKQCRGLAREQWGTLTDDARAQAAGTRERRAGKVQEQRGISRQEAARQLADFMSRNRNWWDLTGR